MRAGSREVVGTGTIVTLQGDDSVEIEYANLHYKLSFLSDASGQSKVTGAGTGPSLTLELINFDNPQGLWWSAQVGAVSGKALFLALNVITFGETGKQWRKVNYTFSLEGS